MNSSTALKKGELHIAGLNTGIVPLAVQRSGFVPLCTFGREDGTFGYTMQLLVPADSPIKDIDGVKGHKVTLTRPDSNSGCKVLLIAGDEYDLQPDRDYTWGFSLGHEESIKGVAAKEFEAAPVASDILARMVEQNEVDPNAFRSIHESERFPPATIGFVYNLTPELRDAIRETLLAFELPGTGLEGEFGADVTKLVPVNYKQDWANARRIDQLVAQVASTVRSELDFAALTQRFVEQHGGGRRHVETVGQPVHGQAHGRDIRAVPGVAQPFRFAAQYDRRAGAHVGIGVDELGIRPGGDDRQL